MRPDWMRGSVLFDWRSYPALLVCIGIGIWGEANGWSPGAPIGLALAVGYWLGYSAK